MQRKFIQSETNLLTVTLQVRQAQSGDPEALAALIRANRTWVRAIAYAILHDPHLAEDATQEVCMRLVRHLHKLDSPARFREWLYRMTHNAALSFLRKQKSLPRTFETDDLSRLNSQSSVIGIPGQDLQAREGMKALLNAVNALPQIYREVLILKHVEDLSYFDMSKILGVNIKSLEVRLVRARKLLQKQLTRSYVRRRNRDP